MPMLCHALLSWGRLGRGSAPSRVELRSEAAVTDGGVRAPPGGGFWECQVRARGPLDSKLSPAVLYQYQDLHGDAPV